MNTIHVGDALDVLRTLPDESVQTCITSPPYYGLRDYGCDGQIGLEKTIDKYVQRLVEVFREVRRVLRDDGTVWLNLGDSYAGGRTGRDDGDRDQRMKGRGDRYTSSLYDSKQRSVPSGLKPKDLCGIPWRVAFALQADGWYLRSDIIWHKPNPMPESVKDRCTKAHEYIFLLSKSARYYFDAEAILEPFADDRNGASGAKSLPYSKGSGRNDTLSDGRRPGLGVSPTRSGRNRRTVWTVSTRSYKGAHFAVYPPELIEPCVLAGSAEGDTVLDPFSGAGTTGVVALAKRRKYIGIELNPTYAEMAARRIRNEAPMFNAVEVVGIETP